MSMLLRRRLMGQGGEPPTPPTGLGEFSRGYAATLTPDSTREWTIQHDIGVTPKCVIIEMVGDPTMTNYGIGAIYELDTLETLDGLTGFMVGKYHYNGSDSYTGNGLPSSGLILFDSTSVTVYPVYSSGRSPWDTGSTYRVQVYG